MSTPQRPMKDGLNKAAVERLAAAVNKTSSTLPTKAFVTAACRGLNKLELKDRVIHVADTLASCLPADIPTSLATLRQIPNHWDSGDQDDPLRGFVAWPLFMFVSRHGLGHFEDSLETLRVMTHMFSAEFAVRPFIKQNPARSLQIMGEWVKDPDEHVRRLVSEGSRPRLPWGERLTVYDDDLAPILSLLEDLRDDTSEYVRRSVANHLNDIAKDQPEVVLDTAEQWMVDASPERVRLIRHALRTLVKNGSPRVWPLLGYTSNPQVEVNLQLSKAKVAIGGSQEISVEVKSTCNTNQKLVVDFIVHHRKANGSLRPKVFKLREVELPANGSVEFTKKIPFRPITTRRYYPGFHRVEILACGEVVAGEDFELTTS
jgi:3-methyladenine DNA glycosylase AlkC